MTKPQLRKVIAKKRTALDAHWVEQSSERVVKNLMDLEAFQTAEHIAFYRAISGEVQLNKLFSICWKLHKRTYIPVFNRMLEQYQLAEITDKTRFKKGHFGIQEPIDPFLFSTELIDLMVLPGVAFDLQGNRLGRGGGYYDRLLEGFSGEMVAVAFDFQIFQQIPIESHDKPVDFIISETKILKV